MKEKIIEFLKEKSAQGLFIAGDALTGYHFYRSYDAGVVFRAMQDFKKLAKDNGEHWQELSADMDECIKESGIKLNPQN